MRDAECNATLEPSLAENAVDETRALAPRRNENVIEPSVCLDREAALGRQGMAAPDEASKAVAEERSTLKLRVDLGPEIEGFGVEQHRVDGEIDFAGFQAVGEALR